MELSYNCNFYGVSSHRFEVDPKEYANYLKGLEYYTYEEREEIAAEAFDEWCEWKNFDVIEVFSSPNGHVDVIDVSSALWEGADEFIQETLNYLD